MKKGYSVHYRSQDRKVSKMSEIILNVECLK